MKKKPQTQSAYAASKGVSRQHINKLVKQGIIKLTKDKKIDPAKADAAIADYADPSRDDYRRNSGPKASQEPDKGSMAYWRRMELQFKTALKKLEHDEKVKTLVNAEDYDRIHAAHIADAKVKLRAIPSQVSQEIYYLAKGAQSEREGIAAITNKLRQGIDNVLEELSKWKPR